ncbi:MULTISPECIES: hypothetical protein [unclassified Methylobacterium]|nr:MULTISPECIES: hypothetical protein [unclassified Methylobacterium]
MADEQIGAEIAEIVVDDRPLLPVFGLIGIQFATLLGLLIWLS